jgi:hypothetical protein
MKHTKEIKDALTIKALRDNDTYFFNESEGGGALVQRVLGVYLLAEIPLYGGEPQYIYTYYPHQIPDLLKEAYSWA